MKKLITIIALLATGLFGNAQDVLYNNGSILQVNTGCLLQVNGNLTNTVGSTLTNDGTVTVIGNTTNNQVMSVANAGTLAFTGTTAQTLNGSTTFFAKNVVVNNTGGVTLNTPLKVDGTITFTNGNITAATTSTPLIFTTNGTHSGTADASHVVGYVVKEGTGAFTYPVGDATKYQKVDVNLTANSTGMRIIYNTTDAGVGAFTTGGTDATALVAYNKFENWDITPLSTATGTVTIYWDAYKNVGIASVSHVKVAHKTSGNWLNEGTTGTGTTASGSVTSNSLSSWSPFTLGSVNSLSTLPLYWLSVTANINSSKQAIINWQVQENNVANYVVEKTIDNRQWNTAGTTNSKGDGTNNYTLTDLNTFSGIVYYRIKQIDKDGQITYSSIIKLTPNNYALNISIYPNPVKDIVTISGVKIGSKAILTDASGKLMQLEVVVTSTSFTIDMSKYSSGVYLFKQDNGVTQKIIKN